MLLFAVQLVAQCCLPARFCCRCGWLSSTGRALTGLNPTDLGIRPGMLIEQQISERRERTAGAIAKILKRPTGAPYSD